jgi:ATP-dependent exoDNAse (exonuclease V) beta subunit
MDLTAEQANAVERRDRSLLLSATAGSGKTRVLVERFARAVACDRTPPERILTITFTDKAAYELQTRIRARLGELGERDAAREAEAAFISTIHGFCTRLLRSEPLGAGLDPHFEVLDEAGAAGLQDRAFDRALDEFFGGRTGVAGERALELSARFGLRRLEQAIRALHEQLRSRGESTPSLPPAVARGDRSVARAQLEAARAAAAIELGSQAEPGNATIAALERIERCGQLLGAQQPSAAELSAVKVAATLRSDACQAYNDACDVFAAACADVEALEIAPALDALLRAYGGAYRLLKRARGALDFDDLELEALALLRSDRSLCEAWAERFELVMVDEFQDVNPRQAALLELLERDNLLVVGDPFQSIYGFRHADPGLLEARRGTLAARGATATLEQNFRSHPDLISAVNLAFGQRFGEHYTPLRAARPDDGQTAPRLELLVTDTAGWGAAGGGPGWRRAEAQLVGERLAELLGSGQADAATTVVLLRAATSMATYERALAERGVATLAVGGGFWSGLEVQDLLGYLRALANPLDTVALYTLLGSPLVGLSTDALALIGIAAERLERDPWWTIRSEPPAELEAGERERLLAFAERFAAERLLAPRLGVDVLLSRALEASGYEDRLLSYPGGPRRLANVRKLVRIARRFEAAEGRDLRGLVDHLRRVSQAVPREPDAPTEADGALRLMTIHAAKGLEADVVCVADLGRAYSNGSPPLLVSGERLGFCVPQPDGANLPALHYEALLAERRGAERAEEDRILYVAMTRARERLLLSGASAIDRWGSETGTPLGWVGPALVEALPREHPAVLRVEADGRQLPVRVVVAEATAERALEAAPVAAGPTGAPSPWPPAPRAAHPGPSSDPAALSYSGLSSYASCGYRYYLERVLGLPEVSDELVATNGGGALDARQRGSLAHALLERLDFGRPVAPIAEAVSEAAAALSLSPAAGEVEEVAELVAQFMDSPLCARLAAARAVRREHPFGFMLGETLLNGFLDVVAEEPGLTLVVDYKSDRVGDRDLEALTEHDYGAQRLLYALAALRQGAPLVEVAHCYLERPEEPVSVSYAAADIAALEARVLELAAGIAAERFEVAAEPHRGLCAGCPGRARLCSWDRQMTARELAPA